MSYSGQFSLEYFLPGLKGQSLCSYLGDIDLSNVTTLELPTATTVGGSSITTSLASSTGTSATQFYVASSGTNYGFLVDESTASAITGLKIKAAASGSGVALTSLGGTNELITIDTKGTGTLGINSVNTSAGAITLGNSTSLGGVTSYGPTTLQSASATALTVGANGVTNPVLTLDASTGSVVGGLKIKGNTTTNGVALQVTDSGATGPLTIDAKAGALITMGNAAASALGVQVGGSTSAANAQLIVYSSNAVAFAVGRQGTTTPSFAVNANTGSQIAGLLLTGAITGGTVAMICTDSGSNASLSIDGKGNGTIKINNASTSAGIVSLGNATSGAGVYAYGAINNFHAPTAANATTTLSGAQVATGYITSTSAAPVTLTLPTGTNLGSSLSATQGTVFDLYIDNTAGSNTITIAVNTNAILSAAAAANGGSQGLLTVPSGVTGQACFRLMFSSSTAYTFTRIA